MSIRTKILSEMKKIATEQSKPLRLVDDNLVLTNSGFDSLCFAILVTRLEDAFGFDPFTMSDDVYFPVTFGEFVAFYEAAFQESSRQAAYA